MTIKNGKFSLVLAVGAALLSTAAFAEKAKKDVFLHELPQANGMSFAPSGDGELLVATYAGIFSIAPDGLVTPVDTKIGGMSELIRHPDRPSTLLSSGYRSEKLKLGVARSDDGGKTWAVIAKGGEKPVAFHAMAFSPSSPNIVYATGTENRLHVSKDEGLTWEIVSEVPGQAFDLAVSRTAPATIYLATRKGLFTSLDSGKSWLPAHTVRKTATMVDVASDGVIRAFIYGYGFITALGEKTLVWKKSPANFVDRAIMNIEIDPTKPARMLGVADTGAMFVTDDNGNSWKSFEGLRYMTPKRIAQGKVLYEENCAACHGEKGIGENPDEWSKRDESGLPLAPPMNDIAHAWHHPDEQIIETILEGSGRNARMLAWKDYGVTREGAESLTAYIKSLWNFRSLACQGSRHMTCMR